MRFQYELKVQGKYCPTSKQAKNDWPLYRFALFRFVFSARILPASISHSVCLISLCFVPSLSLYYLIVLVSISLPDRLLTTSISLCLYHVMYVFISLCSYCQFLSLSVCFATVCTASISLCHPLLFRSIKSFLLPVMNEFLSRWRHWFSSKDTQSVLDAVLKCSVSNWMIDEMGFKLSISGIDGDRSTNCATQQRLILSLKRI